MGGGEPHIGATSGEAGVDAGKPRGFLKHVI